MTTIERWIAEIGNAAERMSVLGALEGAAGNISLFLPEGTPGIDHLLSTRFPRARRFPLPGEQRLPDGILLITGTGRRLRDAVSDPDAVLCAVRIDGGRTWLHRSVSHGVEPTSEIDSHVGIHATVLGEHPTVHAVIHAQPVRLTYLSHLSAYQDTQRMNRQLMRWQPETIVMLPDGIGVLPFVVPGTAEQGAGTRLAMEQHRLVVWARHGVVARSHSGAAAAADLIEYAEAAATYELLDLTAGRPADGLSLKELRAIAGRFGAPTTLLDRLPDDLLR